jgi:RNA polymerase sigma-70 factor (ECF subfamily)
LPQWLPVYADVVNADEPPAPGGSKLSLPVDNHDLVERCRAGDAEAFREIFRQYRSEVARLVHRMLGRSPDLEDIVQEVLLQVHRSIRDFQGKARFSTWLYRVTVNVVLMHRRAAKSRPVFSVAPEGLVPADNRALPDDQVARLRRGRAFYRLLDRLSDKKRTVFVLHELEGMAPSEIAKIVGAPVLTVRTRLFYARRELLAMIREEPALASLASELSESVGSSETPEKEPA